MTISSTGDKEGPDPLLVHDDETEIPAQPADFNVGLVSWRFISSAIRRAARFWGALAVTGLLIGVAVDVALPPPHQASTSLLLTNGPEAALGAAIVDEQAVVQSRTVAGLALHKLGLQQSVDSFLKSYTATVLTDRVLLITVSAPSSNDAVSRATALATEFLAYRASQLEVQQYLVFASLDQQVSQANQHITSINQQIGMETARPKSQTQRARLTSLRAEYAQAATALTVLEQSVNQGEAATREVTASQVDGSGVLDSAAPIPPPSQRKRLFIYAALGLIAGLVLGLGIVVVRALISERTYRRDDVALALGAPVKLGVGSVRLRPWLSAKRRLAAAQSTDVQRIVAYLVDAVPTRRAAALAVVPVDDPQVAALSLVSLAVFCAREGRRVVLVDLVSGAPAARLVGAEAPGVHEVRVQDAPLAVGVPDPSSVVPIGPRNWPGVARHAPPDDLVVACASADLVLTLATLDPSLGGEHLATWADDAVVVITAGRSSWTKIHAVGQMVRLAGVRLVAAVLVGVEKTDDSLGVIYEPGADRSSFVYGSGPAV
jgi:capsular polysaccharide biosynthesis protein